MILQFDNRIKKTFENFYIGIVNLSNFNQIPKNPIDDLRLEIFNEIRLKFSLETLKDEHLIRVNRDFFWKIKIDPTKKRPSSEALIRRILTGKEIPKINILVDIYNLISIRNQIAIAGFDKDKLYGNIKMRFSEKNEEFLGIGMKKPLILTGTEIILVDEKNILAIYPYRDANHSKLTNSTKNMLLLTCGVPGFPKDNIIKATSDLFNTFKKYLGGNGKYKIFQLHQ
ncbi:MAG: B3/B4 domain-containing protein [Candidatus Helarchaeota archaeon]